MDEFVHILTSSGEAGYRALSYNIGANSYLVEPVSFEAFLHVMQQIEGNWFSLNVAPPKEEQ
jgi:hypothetical protein